MLLYNMTSKILLKKNSAIISILTAIFSLLVAGESIHAVITYHEARAQLSNTNHQNIATSSTKNAGSQNITGSIKLRSIIGNAIASHIKVSLIQAATTAVQAVGNNSHAVAANLGQEGGFLVYTIWIVDSNYNFHRVVVDAGNGNVLTSENMSMAPNIRGLGGSPLISPPSGPITAIP